MLLVSQLQQFDVELVDFLLISCALGLVLFFLLGTFCAPFLAFVTEGAYVARRKAFLDKCAMQISQTAAFFGVFIVGALAAAVAVFLFRFAPELVTPALIWKPLAFFAPGAGALVLVFMYILTWGLLKKQRALHLSLGLVTALACLAVFLAGFLLLVASQQQDASSRLWSAPYELFTGLAGDLVSSLSLLLLLGCFFCTGVASGAGLSQLWLIARRFRADYGRDYYAFAMRYCARVALCSILPALAFAGGAYMTLVQAIPPEFVQPVDDGLLLLAGGLPLCAFILWVCIAQSERPLRHKPGAFFACLFSALALCAQVLILMESFPPI